MPFIFISFSISFSSPATFNFSLVKCSFIASTLVQRCVSVQPETDGVCCPSVSGSEGVGERWDAAGVAVINISYFCLRFPLIYRINHKHVTLNLKQTRRLISVFTHVWNRRMDEISPCLYTDFLCIYLRKYPFNMHLFHARESFMDLLKSSAKITDII